MAFTQDERVAIVTYLRLPPESYSKISDRCGEIELADAVQGTNFVGVIQDLLFEIEKADAAISASMAKAGVKTIEIPDNYRIDYADGGQLEIDRKNKDDKIEQLRSLFKIGQRSQLFKTQTVSNQALP